MPRTNRFFPPLIHNSSVKTAIVAALTEHGALTVDELIAILGLERAHIQKRLMELRRHKIVTSYAWGGNEFLKGAPKPKNWKVRSPLWALDSRHPLYGKIRRLGKMLVRGFPFRGDRAIKWDRHYTCPRTPIHSLTRDELMVLGDKPPAWILMLLSHAKRVQIETLTRLLGISRGTKESIEAWKRWGIADSETTPRNLIVFLDPNFCAQGALRALARAIDKATGSQFMGLTRARQHSLNRKRLARINRQRAGRRTQGKSYFLTPTGFAVTGNAFAQSRRWPKKRAEDGGAESPSQRRDSATEKREPTE